MDIVCFGQQNWGVTWTGKQQLTSRLALRGHRVLYVDPEPSDAPADPLASLYGLGRGRLPAIRRVGPKELWVVSPRRLLGLGWRVDQVFRNIQIRRAAQRLAMRRPAAFVLHPDSLPRVQAMDIQGLVYMAVDEYTEYGGMAEADRQLVRTREDELLATAHTVFAVSNRLVERWRDRRPDAELLENGSDVEHFSPSRLKLAPSLLAVGSLKGPKLGFFGQLDERLDQDLLLHLAQTHPEWQIVLAGRVKQGAEIGRLERAPNIHPIGFLGYADLPSLARDIDIWLLPYRPIELARSCNPLKVFEYLATGKPVVATPLDGIISARPVISIAGDHESFRRGVEAALADPGAGREDRLAVAAANTWEVRVDRLERALLAAQERAAADGGQAGSRLLPMTIRRASKP